MIELDEMDWVVYVDNFNSSDLACCENYLKQLYKFKSKKSNKYKKFVYINKKDKGVVNNEEVR